MERTELQQLGIFPDWEDGTALEIVAYRATPLVRCGTGTPVGLFCPPEVLARYVAKFVREGLIPKR
jgi:hypothetical protein